MIMTLRLSCGFFHLHYHLRRIRLLRNRSANEGFVMDSATTMAARISGALIRRIHTLVLDRSYDRAHGINTSGKVPPEHLSTTSANIAFASEYTPTPTGVFKRAIGSLGIDQSRFVFVDLGCGRGRTLCMAAEYPFLRVEGVEFATDLYETAKLNLGALRRQQRSSTKVVVHCMDAAEYQIPNEPCVFYLYHPFGAPVLSKVLDNIEASLISNPRPMVFVYVNPKWRSVFEQRHFIRKVKRPWRSQIIDRVTCPEPIDIYRA
jgi:SAM-dependent methyltransferase